MLHPTSFKNNPKLQKQRISSDLLDDEMVEWWYKADIDVVMQFAKKIQSSFEIYRAKVSKILLNESNCESLLNSVCHILKPRH